MRLIGDWLLATLALAVATGAFVALVEAAATHPQLTGPVSLVVGLMVGGYYIRKFSR